jgi:hypothetical protein
MCTLIRQQDRRPRFQKDARRLSTSSYSVWSLSSSAPILCLRKYCIKILSRLDRPRPTSRKEGDTGDYGSHHQQSLKSGTVLENDLSRLTADILFVAAGCANCFSSAQTATCHVPVGFCIAGYITCVGVLWLHTRHEGSLDSSASSLI